MEAEKITAYVALAWLALACVLMLRSVRRGQQLADELAARHPQAYRDLGRPRPSLLYSERRDRFAQFVARRGYEDLDDPPLAAEFEAYKKSEARLVVGLISTMLLVGLLVFAARSGA